MKISVITAVYNREDTLPETMESVAAQTHGDIEHLVIDGASRDRSLALALARRQATTRIYSRPDGGIYDALNRGLRLATGDIVGVLHSDDVFAGPDTLARVCAAFSATDADAVYGDLHYVRRDAPDRVVRVWRAARYSARRLRSGWMPPHPTLFLRRRVIEALGGFDTSFSIAADYDAVLRYFRTKGFRAAYVPEVLVRMRAGGASNGSVARVLKKSREDYRALRKNGVGAAAATLFAKNVSKIPQYLVGRA